MRHPAVLLSTMASLSLLPLSSATSDRVASLAGEWRFQIDRDNRGITERWFAKPLAETIQLPGSMPEQGRGDPVTVDTPWTGSLVDKAFFTAEQYAAYRQPGNIKVPFWLQPETYYAGVAWYQREIEIPAAWQGRRIVLALERPHWTTQVWLDDRLIGQNDGLSVPHEYDLGVELSPGTHRLSIRVDNGRVIDVGENSHSVSDHTQGNWNGIVGRIELAAAEPVWIDELQVYPELAPKRVRLAGRVRWTATEEPPRRVVVSVAGQGSTTKEQTLDVGADGAFAGELALPADAALWDEFAPALHELEARLDHGHTRRVRFGLRAVTHEGPQLLINGRPLFIRGTLECAIFPKTGHPPTDVESWRRVLSVARAHGLNSLRFHSWCPPEAAFVAGDEMGFYFQVEAASWPNQSTTLGEGQPVDAWIEAETLRILRIYGNHPSFVLMASSNEPGGADAPRDAFLTAWVQRHSAADPRRLFTSGAGWPEIEANQYHVRSEPRIQHWEEGLQSRINALPPETRTDYRDFIDARRVPVISHEIGQWCVFPDFSEIPRYTGYLKPRNFEIFRDTLERNGLGAQAAAFVQASGKLQALCYKEDIESALRTPRMGGFQLLDLHDFPGQGTALVGVLNPFWESKGYITAEEFRRFCNSTVPLARLPRRVFTTGETLTATCEVAHFGAAPLPARPVWRLKDQGGKSVAHGEFPATTLAIGNTSLGELAIPLAKLAAPARYRLVVALAGTEFENDWDVWVYPAKPVAAEAEARLARRFDDDVMRRLAAGETVLLSVSAESVRNDGPAPVALGFSSIFWNTSWTNRQAPTTLGILCDPAHPALAQFPTEAHSNWQWWYVVHGAAALRLDDLPRTVTPIVQVIDDWFTSRRLALVIEAKVGAGRLLLTSVDLHTADDPVRRQLRASLLAYAASREFAPKVELTPAQIRSLLRE